MPGGGSSPGEQLGAEGAKELLQEQLAIARKEAECASAELNATSTELNQQLAVAMKPGARQKRRIR